MATAGGGPSTVNVRRYQKAWRSGLFLPTSANAGWAMSTSPGTTIVWSKRLRAPVQAALGDLPGAVERDHPPRRRGPGRGVDPGAREDQKEGANDPDRDGRDARHGTSPPSRRDQPRLATCGRVWGEETRLRQWTSRMP